MKKISLITIVTFSSILLIESVVPAFADMTTAGQKLMNETNKMQSRMANMASKAATRQSNDLSTIISHSNTLISNRIASLNALSTRIQNDNRLSSNEKSSLSTEIQTDITGLNNLKAKIDADKDVTTARSDEKTIITNYYVYAAFEPKTRLLITLNNLQTEASYMQALVPQLQNLINTLHSQGKNTTQLQSLLSDISSQIQTINTTLTKDIATIQNVSTTSAPASGTFSQVKTDISQIVRTDFAKIRSDFQQMRPLFKEAVAPSKGTPAPSAAITVPTTSVPSQAELSPTSAPSITP